MLEFFFGIFFTFKYSTRSIETVSCDAFLQKKRCMRPRNILTMQSSFRWCYWATLTQFLFIIRFWTAEREHVERMLLNFLSFWMFVASNECVCTLCVCVCFFFSWGRHLGQKVFTVHYEFNTISDYSFVFTATTNRFDYGFDLYK